VAILVDEAIWPWRGERWAHLISDVSVAELHEFSRTLRIRRLSFSGDHYDVNAAARGRAIELGATATTGRDIVRRLRAAGLRRRDVGHWREIATVPVQDLYDTLLPLVSGPSDRLIEAGVSSVIEAGPTSQARIAARGEEVISVVTTAIETAPRLADGFELRVTPSEDGWFTELAAHPREVGR
jgi:hypothetical protein